MKLKWMVLLCLLLALGSCVATYMITYPFFESQTFVKPSAIKK